MADIYGDIRPRQIDEFGNPVIPTGSLRDYATIAPPMGAYGTVGTGLIGSLAAAVTAVDNIPIIASDPRPDGEEEEGGGRRKKKEKEEINLKTAGGQKTQQSQPHLHKQAITEKQLKSRKE
ncbi:hypothetical protein RHSIM_Rhsim08G0122400 [Rhododendron simsii]|uniref:Uncharacterized protein n=1 Tax=Rhododendron simsii TaxID=118357 RepID=A0A834LH04_RHOSS|nr:hypothetical protein RHSIM_Rhsim08G0122400 [Rhododendron simsii]